MGLHQFQSLIGIFFGGTWWVVVHGEAFHAPNLEHGRRCNDSAFFQVTRIVNAHDFAPLANHGSIDFVPCVNASVFFANQGADIVHPFVFRQGLAPSMWGSGSRSRLTCVGGCKKCGFLATTVQ